MAIFEFSSETAERNSTKLDRKKYNVSQCSLPSLSFSGWSKQYCRPCLWLLRHFRRLIWNRWTESNETWQEERTQRPLSCLRFSGRSEKQAGRPVSDWLRHFRLFLWNRWTEFSESWQEAISQCPLTCLWFSGWSVNKMAALANLSKTWHIVEISVLYVRRMTLKLTGRKTLK